MADEVTPLSSPTTNYGWAKPAVGGDPDAWGGMLNTDLDGIDSTVFIVSGVANAALPKSGGTLTGALTPSQTAGIVGTTANNNANTGSIGEYVNVDKLSNVAMTSNVAKNIASISLTAGDWDVQGAVQATPSAGNATAIVASISTVSNTVSGGMSGYQGYNQLLVTGGASLSVSVLPTTPARVSVAATTTVYLVGMAIFASGTCQGQGSIWARRVR